MWSLNQLCGRTSCEIPVILLYLWVPAFPNHCWIPESRSWRALSEDEGNTNNTDNEESGDKGVQKPRLTLALPYYSQHQDNDRDFAKACTHNMESLSDPIELYSHYTLISAQIIDMPSGPVVHLRSRYRYEGEGKELSLRSESFGGDLKDLS